ncbi:cytochrome P450 3A9-like [Liolophura sinensis]|uniref:cytochrome P450 3A9-like n=1 Tax=Liolophura sinensis TaxID=3198878 RepID=UPI00315872A3
MWFTEALSWAPSWLWYLLAITLLIYLYGIWPYLSTSIRLPGPKPSLFFGNLIQLNKTGALNMEMMCLKKYGRVFLSWRGRNPVINIADPDMVKQICVKEFKNFANRGVFLPLGAVQKSMITNLEDNHWKFVRSVLTPAFSSGKMRRMNPLIHICLQRLMDNLSEICKSGKSFELKRVMGGLTMEVIGAVGFGIETDAQKDLNDRFITMAKKVFEDNIQARMPVLLTFLFPFMKPVFEALNFTSDPKDATDFFVTMLSETIEQRRKEPSPRKDLLQVILDSNVDDLKESLAEKDVDVDALKMDRLNRNKKLTDTEVIAQCIVFLLAGYDATASALSYFAYNMAVHPECQEKLIREIDEDLKGALPMYDNVMTLPYLDMCLSETQRLYPAVRGVGRKCQDDIDINGLHIPAGATVLLMGYALQHDETYWPQPEKFDPDRWSPEQKASRHPYVYFPFGVGPRNCIGMRLALMEAKMAIVAILQKFRFIRAPETQVPLTLKKGAFVQPEHGIWLRIESRD